MYQDKVPSWCVCMTCSRRLLIVTEIPCPVLKVEREMLGINALWCRLVLLICLYIRHVKSKSKKAVNVNIRETFNGIEVEALRQYIRGGIQNIPDWCRHVYSSCVSPKHRSQQAKLWILWLWQKRASRNRSKNGGDGWPVIHIREGTTSRSMAADRPYGEFYDFYSVSQEYFRYTLVFSADWSDTVFTLHRMY
jgi:hypothetical protein